MESALIDRNTEAEVEPIEAVEAEICQLSAHLAAATCRWLSLVAEFDRREGWAAAGARSCAAWLSWRCGVGLVAARQQVRVARQLEERPLVRAAFAAGELSYSKARALCRMATPASEAELVALARHATAAHLERLARARRGVDRQAERDATEARHLSRHLHWFFDDDGSFVITARLDPEEGALMLRGLEAARHALDQGATAPVEGGDSAASPRATNADALALMADTMVAHGPAERAGADRYQVVVVADAQVLSDAGAGRCEVEGGPALDPDTARRLACDARIVAMIRRGDAGVLDVGRATRSIPPAIRRALRFRDRGCRFPGCTQARFVDGHHIVHWAEGGETSLSNLVSLCRFHHRALHERGFGLRRDPGTGELVFTTPEGDVVPAAPLPEGPVACDPEAVNRRLGVVIGTDTGACLWGGERLDLGLCLDALLCLEASGAGGDSAESSQPPPAPARRVRCRR